MRLKVSNNRKKFYTVLYRFRLEIYKRLPKVTNDKDFFEIKIHNRGKYKFIVYVSDTTAGRLLEELIKF